MVFDPSQGDGAQLLDIMQLQATLAGYSLVDPTEAEVTPGSSDLTVDVASAPSGVRLGSPAESFGGKTDVGLPAPNPDNPRKALVYLDSDGTVQVEGSASAAAVPDGAEREQTSVPTVPIPNEDFVPLAEVWLAAGAADVSADDISSRKVPAKNIWTPSGVITMWAGNISDIPVGWSLCDGTDGTPDLRNRFVAGAGDEYNVGDTGGEKNHTLTEDEMPSHTHSYNKTNVDNDDAPVSAESEGNSGATSATTGTTGGNQAHENRPRFYSLAYIQKQ